MRVIEYKKLEKDMLFREGDKLLNTFAMLVKEGDEERYSVTIENKAPSNNEIFKGYTYNLFLFPVNENLAREKYNELN